MVIRIATFANRPAAHADKNLMEEFRSWMKSQPGFRAAWHAHDTKTGHATSVSIWSDMASALEMKNRTFPGGSMGIKPDRVELFDQVEEF